MSHVPSDVVAALLFLTQQDKLWSDPVRLHRALYDARARSPLLARFGFSTTGPAPTSRALAQALADLKLARVIRMENTDYDRYLLEAESRRYVEETVFPRFTKEELDGLRQAAEVIRERCGAAVARS